MKKHWLVFFVPVIIICLITVSGCTQAKISEDAIALDTNSQQTGIWVSAEGEVYAPPDVAILDLGIEAESKTVVEAQSQAASVMDAVMSVLTRSGIEDKDIQTSQYTIEAIRKWNEDSEEYIVTGYRVTNIVTVKIRAMEKTGQIIDSVSQAGGDLTRISNIGFMVEDPTNYQELARQEAVAKAISKAEQLASHSGITLGEMLYLTESTGYVGPVYKGQIVPSPGGSSINTSISPGQQKITVTVSMVFDMK